MAQDEQIARISAVQAKYTHELLQKANVVGTAVGLKMTHGSYTEQLALVVMVSVKVPVAQLAPEDRVPPQLEGVVTDVQETGTFVAQ